MNLIKELKQTEEETLRCFNIAEDELNTTYASGKWSIQFILHHLADVETILFERIRRVISNPQQVIWGFDQDVWADKLNYDQRPLHVSKDIYKSTRAGIMHYKENGDLEFVHSEAGIGTLSGLFEKVARHNKHHLDQINQAL